MNLKSYSVLALALVCGLSAGARTKKKSTVVPVKAEAVPAPVPADSLSYAVGVAQGASLKQYLIQREGVDSSLIGEAVRGLNAPLSDAELSKALAYASGLRIRQMNIRQVIPSLNQQVAGKSDTAFVQLDALNKGLTEILTGQPTAISTDAAMKLMERQTAYLTAKAKQENAAYLAANARKKGVVTDKKTGLQYKVLTQGKGALPNDSSEVEVNYEGQLIDGTVFDSSYNRGKAATFRVNQVIKGWQQALKMMPVGSIYEVYIPYDLGYGEQGTRGIPPYSTLIFKVELLGIKDAKAASTTPTK